MCEHQQITHWLVRSLIWVPRLYLIFTLDRHIEPNVLTVMLLVSFCFYRFRACQKDHYFSINRVLVVLILVNYVCLSWIEKKRSHIQFRLWERLYHHIHWSIAFHFLSYFVYIRFMPFGNSSPEPAYNGATYSRKNSQAFPRRVLWESGWPGWLSQRTYCGPSGW